MLYKIQKLSEPNRYRIYKCIFGGDNTKYRMLTPDKAKLVAKSFLSARGVRYMDLEDYEYYPEESLFNLLIERINPSYFRKKVSFCLFDDYNYSVSYFFDHG